MRYHYKKPEIYIALKGETYICDHPIYNRCTLFKNGKQGLAVIQQRKIDKFIFWSEIDPWLNDDIYFNSGFDLYFQKYAKEPMNGLYPTITVRKLMWALRMKPLPKERWETTFDRFLV